MSGSVNIGPMILDVAEFIGALMDLRAANKKAESLRTSDGAVHKVEHVFKDGLGRDAGLQKTDKGYKVIADCHGLSQAQLKQQQESVTEIVRRYAQRKVVKDLQAQGYVIAEEEKRPDNTIRILARKWG